MKRWKMIITVLLLITTSPVFSLEYTSFCLNNLANFNYELERTWADSKLIKGWGPERKHLPLDPQLHTCNQVEWQRERIIAAADVVVKQKINYCHHYLPNYPTPTKWRSAKANQGGYCSPAKNIMPKSAFYGQQVRWNYQGHGMETPGNWTKNIMWYGVDCSNYTTFLYNFALGKLFSSDTEFQAGQRADRTQVNLSPNQQTADNVLDNPKAAGRLVCKDNTLEVNNSCDGHGGYLSVIDRLGIKKPGSIRASDLAKLPLYPGDLLFISTPLKEAENPSAVVHVVMWTGKKVGYGSNDIRPERIAPNSQCPVKDWTPHKGDWVITDSHYQGPDYRVLTACYYLNNLWGVRRVLY